MGAYDVHRAHLIGTIVENTEIVAFMELVDKVMTQEPYAQRVDGLTGSSTTGHRTMGSDRSTG